MRKSDLVFFLSGAAALSYETTWARLLARVLGSDAPAAAIVLATFMGGMGLGAAACSELARRTRSPVRLFAALEFFVAAWAALSPWMIAAMHPVDGFLARASVSALLLLPPTFCLGATFPLMGRLAIRTRAEATSETSAFYGANTLGAALGALLAPFALMPVFGLSGALVAAAGLDVAAAALALVLLCDSAPVEPELVALAPRDARGPASRASAIGREPYAAFLLGATSLALEVLLLRLLVTVTGASVYAFAIVLSVFLFGIGFGSRQLTERRTRSGVPESRLDQSAEKSRNALFFAALSVPLLTLAGLFALKLQLGEADLFGGLGNRVPQVSDVTGKVSILKLWLGNALFAGLCLLPPALAFGVALPACAASLVARRLDLPRERALGAVYAWNTAGALLGSLAAGFVLLPFAGPRAAIAIVLCLPIAAAFAVDRSRLRLIGIAAASAVVLAVLVLRAADPREARAVIVQAHDAHTTALVEESRTTTGELVRSLRVNGKPEASTARTDVRLQRLLAHIPCCLHGRVRTVLVIGLGTGMTAGSLLDAPTLEHLTIFEISSAVAQAARSFAAVNGRVLDDPRTDLRFVDGRHALALSREHYDLITSDPVHPWTRGSSDLYTLEHFRSVRAHLSAGGVASQWLPLYELSTEDVKTIVATWCAAFERTSAWLTAYDLVLVGSADAGTALAGESSLATLELPARVAQDDAALGIVDGRGIAALQAADDADLRALVEGVPPMRDDRPVIEFRAPLSALAGYNAEILRWAVRTAFVAKLPAGARDGGRRFRALVTTFLDELPRGFTAAADHLGEALATSTIPPIPRRPTTPEAHPADAPPGR